MSGGEDKRHNKKKIAGDNGMIEHYTVTYDQNNRFHLILCQDCCLVVLQDCHLDYFERYSSLRKSSK